MASIAEKQEAKERAKNFHEMFQPIAKDLSNLNALTLNECLDVLEELVQDTLDEVWKQTEYVPAYPEARMKHLLDIIGENI